MGWGPRHRDHRHGQVPVRRDQGGQGEPEEEGPGGRVQCRTRVIHIYNKIRCLSFLYFCEKSNIQRDIRNPKI